MESLSILVIDDETGIREGCKRVLTADGHQVDSAEDGNTGFEKFRAGRYDIALVDLRMPGLSGLELLQAMQEHDPEVVTIIITAYASLDTAVEATKRGAYDYLAKPFTPDELNAAIGRAANHRRVLLETGALRRQRRHDLLALASEQSRLRTIIDCMTDGLLVINRDRQIVLYNPAALRMLHQTDISIGNLASDCIACQALVGQLEEALKRGGGKRISRELTLSFAAEEVVLLVTTAPVIDENGESLGVVAVLRDITELKQIERVKASFVNMVSHELRAPMSAVRGYLDVMLEGIVKEPNKQKEMLRRMQARTDGLLALVDDLLTVSRLDQARVSRTLAPIILQPVVEETLRLFEAEAKTREINLEYVPSDESLAVIADGEELRRVYTNLISNAIKYNRPGGWVKIAEEAAGGFVRISVRDSGIGVPADALPKLGKEFFRVKNEATKEVVGTGLGLSVVKRILEAHHGRLEMTSEEGEGSTFTILLPKA